MSRQRDEEKGRKAGGRLPAGKAAPATGFIAFHPTEAERNAVKAIDLSLEGQWEYLGDCVDRGIDFKLTRNVSDNAYCLVAREKKASYQEGVAISVFHANVSTLVALMFYALTVKWPDFPEMQPTYHQSEFDW